MKIYNTEKLEADILAELKLINNYSYKAINEIEANKLDQNSKILKLISYVQYMERKSINIRLLVNQFSASVNDNIMANFSDDTGNNDWLNEGPTITVSSQIDWDSDKH